MGLKNIISGLFNSTSIERRAIYSRAPPRDVIKEMSEKYGEVDMTPKDVIVIYDELGRVRKKLRDHNNTKMADRVRCKTTEDAYFARRDELRAKIVILDALYIKVVEQELNKFPLNKACTPEYVAEHIGVKELIVWRLLILGTDTVNIYLHCNDRYNMRIKNLSDKEINITLTPGDRYHAYGALYDDYCDSRGEYKGKVYNILLPNWRFVASLDSSMFYIERIS